VDAPPEIRSFRSVFALERRIYRIDTMRLNPSGIPLRGIAYGAALVVASLLAGALPPTSWLDPIVPWYLRDIGIPLALAAALGSARIDGRAFHLAAYAAVIHVAGPRRLGRLVPLPTTGRWRPPTVVCLPDGSDARFRALRYRGPGVVLVRGPHVRRDRPRARRADLTLHPIAGTPPLGGGRAGSEGGDAGIGVDARTSVLELAAGAVLEVRTR
jgi:hypothetical protein